MSEPGVSHGNSSGWGVRRMHRTAWLALVAGLVVCVWPAAAEEIGRGAPPAASLGSEPFLNVVDDTELSTMYGKGYERPALRADERLSVILWDEGKRKVRISGTGMNVVTYSSDVSHQCAERSR